ncbi:MAG: hypothetical protein HY587_03505 [Candidatus Omnitrophica bacterium]|nr:hypothetical protein [Candidatus Omnitrophota bacterium]
MIGSELWDRTIFGILMIVTGAVFLWLIRDKSWILAAVGVLNILFGAYVIWGAFAWEEYRKEVHRKFGKSAEDSKDNRS